AGERPYRRRECGKGFGQSSNRLAHLGEELHECPECQKCFPERSLLLRHKRVHAGEKPFR
ncbi:ZN714 protein, partial [Lophotis ruficrista]|nr:ZN714 protein [Lophotis ruficrista]